MSPLRVFDGSDWDAVITRIHAWDGTDWDALISKAYAWDGDSWNQIWSASDPLTTSFYASWTRGYMYSTGQECVGSILAGVADNDLIQGYWDVSQGDPAGTWSHVQSAMYFDGLSAALALRPVIVSASLRLTLDTGYGGDPKNTNVVMGQLPTDSTVEYASWAHSDVGKGLQDTGDLYTADGQTKTITLNSAMRTALGVVPGIALHDPTHSTSESGKRATRAIFNGASAGTSIRPQLTVTLDVA